MRLVVQRVTGAEVSVDGRPVGKIGAGMVVLAGVEVGDGPDQAEAAAAKLAGLRFFDDERGRMNLDVRRSDGSVLLVSQFTLAASTRKGRRPSFDRAAPPEVAEPLLEELRRRLEAAGVQVECGRFGARMRLDLINDGPVTFVLDFQARQAIRKPALSRRAPAGTPAHPASAAQAPARGSSAAQAPARGS